MNFPETSKLAMNANEATSVAEALTRIKNPILEPKLDGIRVLVNIREDGVRYYARSGNRKYGLTKIEAELAAVFPAGTWLDAEAVAFNADGTQNWGGAMSCLGSNPDKAKAKQDPIRLVVFDILSYGETDARAAALRQRREVLEKIFADNGNKLGRVLLAAQFEATQENHDAIVARGYEGTMIKDLTKPYISGRRGWEWIKIKLVQTVDTVVIGYKPGKGKFKNMIGAIVFGQYHDGELVERGACSGMDDALRLDITNRQDELLGAVMEISYRTYMVDKDTGLPNYRHPQFERFRWDKEAHECTVDSAVQI
jgi:ATP-dependent DNA ligase